MEAWTALPRPGLPGTGDIPRLYDAATATVKRLPARGSDEARMYVCGITPYDATHLGHAATYVTFDLLHRVWLDAGLRVRYAQNVTDVDDPLLERATRDGVDWRDLAGREIALYRDDMAALNVLPPHTFLGVTETIPLVEAAVVELRSRGAAYDLDGDIYFSVDADPHFGSVAHWSRQRMLEVFAERGGDPDRTGKKNPLDPLLWRAARDGEPSWDTVLGAGRPGWHIECTAIALDTVGMAFDVQGGGCDLAFPHHEMSASHASVLTEADPYARAYVHVGMVGMDGEKMSKSKGNLVFVSELRRQGVDPAAIRLLLLSHHYQHDWEWSPTEMTAAEERLERWRVATSAGAAAPAHTLVSELRSALAADLDSPEALARMDAWVQESGSGTGQDPEAPALARAAVGSLLGVAL
jgi:L-cysteine:1D-myo-inositol 2-amino-2-deoxy-alpha-D-glucopyranoside ligase